MAQQQGHAVGVGQTQIAEGVLHHGDGFHLAEGVQQPRQVNAENLAHTAGAHVADKEIFVIFPGVPVGQVLPDVVNVMHRLTELLHLCLDVLRFAAVQHGAGQKQRQIFGGGLGHVLGVAVADKVQLGKNGQIAVEQFADNGRVGQWRGADQGGVGVQGGSLGDGGAGFVRQLQPGSLLAALLGGVYADDLRGSVNSFAQARTALAHAAQTDDQKFHRSIFLSGSKCGTGPS